MTRRARLEVERAKETGFLVTREHGYVAQAAFWRWCEANKRPRVLVKPRQRFATVDLDMLPSDHVLSPEATLRALNFLRHVSSRRATVLCGPMVCLSDHVLIEHAREAARFLWRLALAEIQRAKGEVSSH